MPKPVLAWAIRGPDPTSPADGPKVAHLEQGSKRRLLICCSNPGWEPAMLKPIPSWLLVVIVTAGGALWRGDELANLWEGRVSFFRP